MGGLLCSGELFGGTLWTRKATEGTRCALFVSVRVFVVLIMLSEDAISRYCLDRVEWTLYDDVWMWGLWCGELLERVMKRVNYSFKQFRVCLVIDEEFCVIFCENWRVLNVWKSKVSSRFLLRIVIIVPSWNKIV